MDLPPLPESFFRSLNSDRKPRHLLTGMIWTFVGLGLFVALREVAGRDVAWFALIPIGVGLALLIYYFVEGRKLVQSPPQEPG